MPFILWHFNICFMECITCYGRISAGSIIARCCPTVIRRAKYPKTYGKIRSAGCVASMLTYRPNSSLMPIWRGGKGGLMVDRRIRKRLYTYIHTYIHIRMAIHRDEKLKGCYWRDQHFYRSCYLCIYGLDIIRGLWRKSIKLLYRE